MQCENLFHFFIFIFLFALSILSTLFFDLDLLIYPDFPHPQPLAESTSRFAQSLVGSKDAVACDIISNIQLITNNQNEDGGSFNAQIKLKFHF